jgi:hypothetical protein
VHATVVGLVEDAEDRLGGAPVLLASHFQMRDVGLATGALAEADGPVD